MVSLQREWGSLTNAQVLGTSYSWQASKFRGLVDKAPDS